MLRVRLAADQQQAHFIRLCINNCSRYAQGRDKFFLSMNEFFHTSVWHSATRCKSWMCTGSQGLAAKRGSGRAASEQRRLHREYNLLPFNQISYLHC